MGLVRIAYPSAVLRTGVVLRIACVECCLPYGDSTSKMFWRILYSVQRGA